MRIVCKYFCAGVEFEGDRVVRAAPILAYMLGWPRWRVKEYAAIRKWAVEEG